MLNRCIVMGRLVADPELRQTTSGIAVCRIRIAVNRPKQKDKEQQADFINCTAWRSTAEFISRYFSKGQMILVEGQLRNNDYVDGNDVKHYSMDVLIDNVSFCESKGSSENQQQTQNNYASAPAAQQQASPAQSPVEQQLDLSDFEEILSDGEAPF